MNLPALGPLHPDQDIPEWLVSSPIPVPYFDNLPLTFTMDGLKEEDSVEVNDAIVGFLKLAASDRCAASPYVYKNYLHMAGLVSKEDLYCDIPRADIVWNYVTPSQIYVSRRHRRDKLIYILIAAECEWEPEHGLQIVYRKGVELSRVSDQDGHVTHADAYDVPEEQDRIV